MLFRAISRTSFTLLLAACIAEAPVAELDDAQAEGEAVTWVGLREVLRAYDAAWYAELQAANAGAELDW